MNSRALFERICQQHLQEWSWIREKTEGISSDFDSRHFYLAFNMIHRKVAEYQPEQTPKELEEFSKIYPGFNKQFWQSRDMVRCLMVLSVPDVKRKKILEDLFSTGDISEQITLYRLLYFLPEPEKYVKRATEGIRTNMVSVFDAIAMNNPYPAKYFSPAAWNQMVLKAVFMERPLYRIFGLDQRSNSELSNIAIDFAHERWAAGRKVTPELWRLTERFITESNIDDLETVLKSSDDLEKEAGLLALQYNKSEAAQHLKGKYALAVSRMSWEEIGKSVKK